ncbi:MAG: RNA polymerase sigma-70 factor [Tannerellaceae bacterium]|nr:RNA polymerase sigma-70 factor [Tannerellaceae bacterium]
MNKTNREEIFRNIFFEYHSQLCAYAFQYIANREIAKDIVQDVFCEFWQQIDKLDLSYSPGSLLYRYTHNKAIDYLKAHREFNDITSLTLAFNPTEEMLEEKELNETLRKSIEELPEQCRKVWYMSRQEGLKNREIAEQLQISIKAVEKQITKALTHLKKKLSGMGYLPCLLIGVLQLLWMFL